MKFSFEAGQHRDELAQEVMSKDKSERQAFLEHKKQTLEYSLASHIRDFERSATQNKDKNEEGVSDIEERDEKITKQEITITAEESRDHHDKLITREVPVELEIVDISDQIPDSVKIIYDMNRLLEVGVLLDDSDTAGGINNYKPLQNADFHVNETLNWDQNFRIVSDYVKMVNREKGTPLLKNDGSPIDEAELERIAKQATEDFKIFRSQITEGLIDNPSSFYHTVGAYTKGWSGDNSQSARISFPQEVISKSLSDRFPHKNDEGEIEEVPIKLDESLQSRELWIHSGHLVYDSMIKPLMIMDGSSEKFRREVYSVGSPRKREYTLVSEEHQLKDALEMANTKNQWGALLKFKKGSTPWLLVADQIFDPYHGRLIKIKEKPAPLPSEEVDN